MITQELKWINTKHDKAGFAFLPMHETTVICAVMIGGVEQFFTAFAESFSDGAYFVCLLPDESSYYKTPVSNIHKWAYLEENKTRYFEIEITKY